MNLSPNNHYKITNIEQGWEQIDSKIYFVVHHVHWWLGFNLGCNLLTCIDQTGKEINAKEQWLISESLLGSY